MCQEAQSYSIIHMPKRKNFDSNFFYYGLNMLDKIEKQQNDYSDKK